MLLHMSAERALAAEVGVVVDGVEGEEEEGEEVVDVEEADLPWQGRSWMWKWKTPPRMKMTILRWMRIKMSQWTILRCPPVRMSQVAMTWRSRRRLQPLAGAAALQRNERKQALGTALAFLSDSSTRCSQRTPSPSKLPHRSQKGGDGRLAAKTLRPGQTRVSKKARGSPNRRLPWFKATEEREGGTNSATFMDRTSAVGEAIHFQSHFQILVRRMSTVDSHSLRMMTASFITIAALVVSEMSLSRRSMLNARRLRTMQRQGRRSSL
jgi:hypothetical protein